MNMVTPYAVAPLHPDEDKRLDALYKLGVLDTGYEKRFDRITDLVSKTMGFPIVLVSLVDANRQWFKSKRNLNAAETTREVSFCAHALNLEDGFLGIPDTLADPGFAENPLVTDYPHIRSYFGMVIYSSKGLPLGTLCCIDQVPRTLDDTQKQILKSFAEITEVELMRHSITNSWDDNKQEDTLSEAMTAEEFKIAAKNIAKVHKDSHLCVAAVDIPNIRSIHNTFGQFIGQSMINEVARRCRLACLNRRYILAKSDVNSFHMLVNLDGDNDTLETFAREVEQVFETRIQVQDIIITSVVRVGLAEQCQKSGDIGQTIREAEIALGSLSHFQKGNKVCLFEPGLRNHWDRYNAIASVLQDALNNDLFHLNFQPKVRVDDCHVVGAEALLRWNDPDLGFISPLEIVEIAAELNLLGELDRWVLSQTCLKIKGWIAAGLHSLPVSVNLSGASFENPNFVEDMIALIESFDIPLNLIDFEILESAIIDDSDKAVGKILKAREKGLLFSLDDFGTGQSSLAYLRALPVNTLKIDRSFLQDVSHDSARCVLLAQIIGIGHTLNMKVVVEGVEEKEEYEMLKSFGCDTIQGYYFSRPLNEVDFVKLLAQTPSKIMIE